MSADALAGRTNAPILGARDCSPDEAADRADQPFAVGRKVPRLTTGAVDAVTLHFQFGASPRANARQ
jgi:hypothetical protein